MDKEKLTQLRLEMDKLINAHKRLCGILKKRSPLIKGTVYRKKTKCGKKGCRCEKKREFHTVWCISRSNQGKSQTRSLGNQDVDRYKKLASEYRKFRQARADLVKLQHTVLETVNRIEDGRMIEPDIFSREDT
jgi:hypothetical protein